MNSLRPGRLRRPAAEQLLDGVPTGRPVGGDPLASLLAAAAAPPHTAEQAGEDAAITAFRAEHLVPASNLGRGQMIKSPLAKILTMKVGALALALGAGGVAVAATTGAFTPSGHASTTGSITTPVASGSQASGSHASVKASMPGTHTGASASGHAAVPTVGSILSAVDAAQVCRELAGKVERTVASTDGSAVAIMTETGLQNALDNPALSQVVDNPEFVSLVATAEGRGNAPDYCGLVLHLAKLASPATLGNLPGSALSAIPASIASQIPGSALTGVPTSGLSKLPVRFLSKLSAPALSGLPASVLAELPASVLKGVLPALPAGALAQLPAKVLAGAMNGMPTGTLTGVVSRLPVGLRTQTLPMLPKSALAGLPKSLLAGLPGSLLSSL
ncbi:MAG TPA: hypothetical protein VHY58_19820 [Streptosporangiaceae bacterium]|jgi:hypothetical protein|nr:hypothetical protein [Streptosporangiaceae bacterium]